MRDHPTGGWFPLLSGKFRFTCFRRFLGTRVMHRALQLAASWRYTSSPSPTVECILISGKGLVIGQGHFQQAGGPHTEIMARRDAVCSGNSVTGTGACVSIRPSCDAQIVLGLKKSCGQNSQVQPARPRHPCNGSRQGPRPDDAFPGLRLDAMAITALLF